ncbi:MAG: hypothetical protein EZS28_016583 [Streblomastix strix]|uniref:Reverse transcriptase domain-containing protein n=1 Tax=Streblomastix strix TaxID=222440 RepID=A0A5J4VZ98_9EUKA|nr:MAG: hypothetical protein EZS28_016583 [Streblomastix strix]
MKTAPQEMEEKIGELKHKKKDNGMGGKTKRFVQTWKQIGKEDFINTGFYLKSKDQNSQQRLEENKMIKSFRGMKEEKEAYQKNVERRFGRRNRNKDSGQSKLNAQIGKLHFKMYGLEEVQYLANQMDYATSLDLKSAFHRNTVSPNSIPYLAFNFNNNNYTYKAMPFGAKHSQIFFAEAIESILRQIRIHSQVKVLNYCDDILLIHQDKQILKTQTIEILKTLEQFRWIISTEKCEKNPKQIISFLKQIRNLKEMNIRMSEERQLKIIQALND